MKSIANISIFESLCDDNSMGYSVWNGNDKSSGSQILGNKTSIGALAKQLQKEARTLEKTGNRVNKQLADINKKYQDALKASMDLLVSTQTDLSAVKDRLNALSGEASTKVVYDNTYGGIAGLAFDHTRNITADQIRKLRGFGWLANLIEPSHKNRTTIRKGGGKSAQKPTEPSVASSESIEQAVEPVAEVVQAVAEPNTKVSVEDIKEILTDLGELDGNLADKIAQGTSDVDWFEETQDKK